MRGSPRIIAPLTTPRYQAFISYAHEDAPTAEWLHTLLRTYWVPGRRKPAIFLDRQSMAAGRGITAQLLDHLRDSEFLIVCWSPDAANSPWIPIEIAAFLETHTTDKVLVCSVGEEGEDLPLPPTLQAIEQESGDPFYRVELRGHPQTNRTRDALSLLAPLVGLKSKDEILDRRRKRRIIAVAVFTVVLIVSFVAWRTWKWWLATPEGLHYLTVQRVLDAAARDTFDEPYLVPTAEALAVSDGREAVEDFANFVKDEEFRALTVGAGLASLRPPDCEGVKKVLGVVKQQTAQQWPRAFLVAQRHCGGNRLAFARPDPLVAKWAIAVADAGFRDEWQRVRDVVPMSADDRVRGSVYTGVDPRDIHGWLEKSGAYDVYYGASQLLVSADRGGRLREAAIAPLLDVAHQAAMSVEGLNSWTLSQSVAASLAGAGRSGEARAVLDRLKPPSPRDPADAPGWAWRALAQQRLGDPDAASKSFDEAFACGRTTIPASRTWDEWREIALAAALAGDWTRARQAAEEPGDERIRIRHHMALLEHWSEIRY